MMRRLLCRLLGHKWEARLMSEILDDLERSNGLDLHLVRCARCKILERV